MASCARRHHRRGRPPPSRGRHLGPGQSGWSTPPTSATPIFGRHLLDTHLIVGQAFALATYSLPTWHQLRPFMQFFTYGTMAVNDLAYQALLAPKQLLHRSRASSTSMTRVSCSTNGIAALRPRPVDRAARHRRARASMRSLITPTSMTRCSSGRPSWTWSSVTSTSSGSTTTRSPPTGPAGVVPDADQDPAEHRPVGSGRSTAARLAELCTGLLWNNVIHEICGDFSPIPAPTTRPTRRSSTSDRAPRGAGDGRL